MGSSRRDDLLPDLAVSDCVSVVVVFRMGVILLEVTTGAAVGIEELIDVLLLWVVAVAASGLASAAAVALAGPVLAAIVGAVA